MTELYELYQQVILDHNKKPRNFHRMETASAKSEGFNPLCGDRLIVYVQLEGDQIKDISFEGSGCAISKASASLMTESVKGKSKAEIEALFKRVHQMLTAPPDTVIDVEGLGKLAAFSGVREFPVRVKCATLAWHTLNSALHGQKEPVTTE
ncbi:SUF system NifU family Fe-S cluster assembly protein [bacterium]|nr:SUF system NifU family Fe-S cluster assembly protein [bacterium]